jgi:hypothetical protein
MTELRIAKITVDYDGREDRYYVWYPSPAPPDSPDWMILDTDGSPVCVDWTVDEVRDFAPDEFVDRLDAAARAAVARGDGERMNELYIKPGTSALEWAEDLGWLARYGEDDPILPDTPVWFPGGLPGGLREQAGGALRRALRLLADCVRKEEAEPLLPGSTAPAEGVVVTAAELAAVTV